jgi:Leucine-rich repeat (LRR) protein
MKKIFLSIIFIVLILNGCSVSEQQKSGNINENISVGGNVSSGENKLDLSGQKLKNIPDYIFRQTNLEELNISNNQVNGSIQAEIRNLQNLKVLNASNNLMTGVPAEIGSLQNLQILDLSNNQLTGLPYEL